MNKTISTLGPNDAKCCFYLPNPPTFPDNWSHNQADAIASLIALNGNHWRKILTIMAKIMCPTEDWKSYRDDFLLKESEQIHINATQLSSQSQIHIVSGQSSATQLSLNLAHFSATQTEPRLNTCQSCLLVPYLDYRQYPNKLIEETRGYLTSLEIS
ncbi:DUF6942 family protein [Shewanella surugensis]|uniref:Uncharacterized protein n=1 Tax=Shewanella surugensis TaxID=212020 RepID=A0ABT0LDA5_9GAMM|nr:hypothetical protein [Shewanella surugensis]MCL1125677.1 hypothetical protein [Shewanella surugensis]